jgi:hypothetical protein
MDPMSGMEDTAPPAASDAAALWIASAMIKVLHSNLDMIYDFQ